MTLKTRIDLEHRIVRRLVSDLLAAGYELTVDNGGDNYEIAWSTSFPEIIAALFATDDERLMVRKQFSHFNSWVQLAYGNDGWDVISDYTTNLDPVIEPINEWTDKRQLRYREAK